MNQRTQRRITAGRIADEMAAPPFPVVEQYGLFYFETGNGYAAAVSVPGGTVYARSFKAWAGRELPECEEFVEPSAVQLVAMLEAQKR
jgi:hypothetical protein